MTRRPPYPTRTGSTTTEPSARSKPPAAPAPGLVLAWAPPDVDADDRAPLARALCVGRSSGCSWCVRDTQLSRAHFEVAPRGAGVVLVDGGSRNGTYVDGRRAEGETSLGQSSVVRAGRAIFVTVEDLSALGAPGEAHAELAGRFHAAPIIRRLRLAVRSGRHILIEGESGTGKELAAAVSHEVAAELGREGPLVAINAAHYGGEDEAIGSLFGVARGTFTGVHARTGALERADGGTLFLDEAHNYPLRVQRSLLRFLEDGVLHPIGQGPSRRLDVRVVLGTNVKVDDAVEDGRLAHDLVARLHRVRLPSLNERRADVPSIFEHVLTRAGEDGMALREALSAPLLERLCLADYGDRNVRILIDVAALARAWMLEGETPADALSLAADELLRPAEHGGAIEAPSSHYEEHREVILATYGQVGGKLTVLEATLRERGVLVTRRWLAHYLQRWGVRGIRRRARSEPE